MGWRLSEPRQWRRGMARHRRVGPVRLVCVAGLVQTLAAATGGTTMAVFTDSEVEATPVKANRTLSISLSNLTSAENRSADAMSELAPPRAYRGSPVDAVSPDRGNNFDYHKPVFPMDWGHDGATVLLAILGLVIAATGGIGGGGILVPLFMLVLQFRPKHAIALSNFTILGGSIANTMLNANKRHPALERGLIDWDLILIMEPLTIFGAVLGSLISKVVPNICLTTSLVLILAYMGRRTLAKGIKMWTDESKRTITLATNEVEMLPATGPVEPVRDNGGDEGTYLELESDSEGSAPSSVAARQEASVRSKIGALTLCFVGACALNVLKGGGNFDSPLGFECGSSAFWWLYFGSLPWVLAFAFFFRWLLVREFEHKVRRGYLFAAGEVRWDPINTLKYPIYCAVAGLLAGLFGVGGGIVKGPLMLEMGIVPSVAAATAAAMILFTSAAASTSFMVFGMLHVGYGVVFFLLGFVSTAVGQYLVGKLAERHNRQSPIVISIGLVICLSSLLVGVNTVAALLGPSPSEFFRAHGVCSTEA